MSCYHHDTIAQAYWASKSVTLTAFGSQTITLASMTPSSRHILTESALPGLRRA